MTLAPETNFASRARTRVLDASGQLSRFTVGVATTTLVVQLLFYHAVHEGWFETVVFATAITATIIAFLTLASRRILFSVAMGAALVGIIVTASNVKRHYIDMVLHAYDVVFYLTSWSTLSFLWVDHKLDLLILFGAFLTTAACGRLVFIYDSSRIPRLWSTGAALLCALIAFWASSVKGDRPHTLFYWDSLYLSSFYASWAETADTLWQGQLLEALASQSQPAFAIPSECTPKTKPPHIILIHQESVVPPSYFPSLNYDHSLDPMFNAFDGSIHRLRVETYGGASWLTEFSVLAGVSTYSFGGMRTFVHSLMQGKIRDTLPQILAHCGYRNALFYPVSKNFVSSGKFYETIGMTDVFDAKAQGATRYNERDHFYYRKALDNIERQLSASNSPLFTYIITAATHMPYTFIYDADVTLPDGAPGTDPEISEYLRRLAMAKSDIDGLRADLRRRFPNESFLLVQYGDHQPIVTRTLLGLDPKASAETIKLKPDSPAFHTYYAVEGINYDPPPLPAIATLDVPYLGAIVLEAAKLPLSQSYAERLRLMRACDGRYYTCNKRSEILSFHRRLMDSGLVDAR
jgi:phosphoglycerol transferase MdoB-like AlkP superfamily enzyme